jgi:PST family polysaccharide transporter
MGAYNLAYNLAEAPLDAMGEQLASVLLPSFSRLTPEQRPKALVRTLALMGLLTFPLGVGLGAVAPTLVDVVLAAEWQSAAPLLAILSVLSVVKPVLWSLNSFGYANQQPRLVAAMGLLKLGLLTVAVATLGRFSILWVCWSIGIVSGLHILVYMRAIERSGGPSMRVMIAAIMPPLLACMPMLALVWYMRPLLYDAGVGELPSLIAQVATGGVVYVVSALLIARSAAKDFLGLVKTKLLKRGGGGDE